MGTTGKTQYERVCHPGMASAPPDFFPMETPRGACIPARRETQTAHRTPRLSHNATSLWESWGVVEADIGGRPMVEGVRHRPATVTLLRRLLPLAGPVVAPRQVTACSFVELAMRALCLDATAALSCPWSHAACPRARARAVRAGVRH